MRNDYTHVCIVLDASGSMRAICNDVKGSFNAFLEKQRTAPGKTVFDLFQFSSTTKRLVQSVDLSTIENDLMADYVCSGCTALNDAVCTAIDTLGREFAAMPEEERPANVLFAIVTDGMENASREFTREDVRERITHQQEVYKWEFVFLAANQDAFRTGATMGLCSDKCVNYSMNSESIDHTFNRMMSIRMDRIRDAAKCGQEKLQSVLDALDGFNANPQADKTESRITKSRPSRKKSTSSKS